MLTIGSIEVDSNGNATGTGLAFAIFEATLSAVPPAAKALIAGGMASFCEGLATAIIEHIQAHAEVTVTVSAADAGLQRTPDPNNPNTATQAPAAPVELATKGTVA
jgi:hypothetical protein